MEAYSCFLSSSSIVMTEAVSSSSESESLAFEALSCRSISLSDLTFVQKDSLS
jgi:hypothetical protein